MKFDFNYQDHDAQFFWSKDDEEPHFSSDYTVTICHEEDETKRITYHVHHYLLCINFAFFNSMIRFKEKDKEASELQLPHKAAVAFPILLDSIYDEKDHKLAIALENAAALAHLADFLQLRKGSITNQIHRFFESELRSEEYGTLFLDAQILDYGLLMCSVAKIFGDDLDDWNELPPELQDNERFAREIVSNAQFLIEPSMAGEILKRFEALRGDRSVWDKIVLSARQNWRGDENFKDVNLWNVANDLSRLISEYAPAELRSDPEFMQKACEAKKMALRLLDVDLAMALEGFLLSLLTFYPWAVQLLSPDIQTKIPAFVERAFQSFSREVDRELRTRRREPDHALWESVAKRFSAEVWKDRAFVCRWFENGFPILVYQSRSDRRAVRFRSQTDFLDFYCPQSSSRAAQFDAMKSAKEDEEMLFLVAKHCRGMNLKKSMQEISVPLRRSKSFWLQMLKA